MKKTYLIAATLLMGASLSVMSLKVSAQTSGFETDPGTATCYSTYSVGGTTTIHKCENGCGTETVSTYSDKQDCTY